MGRSVRCWGYAVALDMSIAVNTRVSTILLDAWRLMLLMDWVKFHSWRPLTGLAMRQGGFWSTGHVSTQQPDSLFQPPNVVSQTASHRLTGGGGE